MSVFMITGKLGGGKSLVSIGRMRDYLRKGRRIATNIDINVEYLMHHKDSSSRIIRLPDKPILSDLQMLGSASTSKKESDNGLLVLDELGTWFNSRTYQDKTRQEVINWLLHSRKLQWDLLLIVQNIDLLDKQARISLDEHVVTCRRTDRLPIPIVGHLYKFFVGHKLNLPRCHIGSVYYGSGLKAIKIDTWLYRGSDLFSAYDTNQVFSDDYKDGVYSYLPPNLLNLKRFANKNRGFYMRLTKIYFRKYSQFLVASLTLLVSCLFFFVFLQQQPDVKNKVMDGKGKIIAIAKEVGKQKELTNKEKIDVVISSDQGNNLVRLNYLVQSRVGKTSIYKLPYQGVVYSVSDFPYKVIFRRGVPYAQLPVKTEALESDAVVL